MRTVRYCTFIAEKNEACTLYCQESFQEKKTEEKKELK